MQLQDVPEPLICSVLVAATLLIVMAQVGVAIVSEDTIVMVIVSPSLVRVVTALSEAIVTVVSVGTVSSWVTPLPAVRAVTATPALPAESEKPIEKATAPSPSLL